MHMLPFSDDVGVIHARVGHVYVCISRKVQVPEVEADRIIEVERRSTSMLF